MSDDEAPQRNGVLETLVNMAEDTQVLKMRVPMSLVPSWSNVLERMCRDFGEEVAAGVDRDSFVVEMRIKNDKKAHFDYVMEQNWKRFEHNRRIIAGDG